MRQNLDVFFEGWDRKPSNTERLVLKLIRIGFCLPRPRELVDMYRIQPKTTGCERRSALSLYSRGGCKDIAPTHSYFNTHGMVGTDLLNPVSDLVENPIVVERRKIEEFLWVYVDEGDRHSVGCFWRVNSTDFDDFS